MSSDNIPAKPADQTTRATTRTRYWLPRLIVLLVICGIGIYFRSAMIAHSQQRTLERAATALAAGRLDMAENAAKLILESDPRVPQALLIAGQVALLRNSPETALKYFGRIPDDGSLAATIALNQCGKLLISIGRAHDAERILQRALAGDAEDAAAHKQLVYLLTRQGRTWDVRPHILSLIRTNNFDGNDLAHCSSIELLVEGETEFTARCLKAVPDDPRPLLREARLALTDNAPARAREILQKIVAANQNIIEAQARLGGILLHSGTPYEFNRWRTRQQPAADLHPEIWYVRGLWAKSHGQPRAAIRCFGEAALIYPDHRGAIYQLSQLLPLVNQPELAAPFAARIKTLSKLDYLLEAVDGPDQIAVVKTMTETLIELGRCVEAAGWYKLMLRNDRNLDWANQGLAQIQNRLHSTISFHVENENPVLQLALLSYPLPQWYPKDSNHTQRPVAVSPTVDQNARIKFADLAAAAGLIFSYENGEDLASEREYLMQLTGGGIAVLDYDADGWPDVYLTQGGTWPVHSAQQHKHFDRLFRNIGDGTFQDVTSASGLENFGYSQGVTVGDFNGDGFPDLYVANIGPNRLYRNNADGTFTDVTSQSSPAGDEWTSSCLIADLNGDSLPDIYSVNYLGGDVFTRFCTKTRRCLPTEFPGEQDRLYVNLGDGAFRDVTSASGIVASGGKGLGIVAADFDGSHRLSLFVGNDSTPNFLFANQTEAKGSPPKFAERSVLSGLAFNEQGSAQACMGIAVGDANGDGLFDLFVTNFFVDSNTLYQQQPDRTFLDVTQQANLRDAGYRMLGWGTQFLDSDLDGHSDLMIANGHVWHSTDSNIPHRMPAQFHRNRGNGQFDEVPADTLGPYFRKKVLGRPLARIDWNRDGREDAVIMHLHRPVALLTNETDNTGHFLAVRLHATGSARDAIGASVRVTTGDRSWTQQLTAGDGFQASNQRQLVFGLGNAQRIDELSVHWPSGWEQAFHDVPSDAEVILVEKQPKAFRIPTD